MVGQEGERIRLDIWSDQGRVWTTGEGGICGKGEGGDLSWRSVSAR